MNKADSEATPFVCDLMKTERKEDWTELGQPSNMPTPLETVTTVKENIKIEISEETLSTPHSKCGKRETKTEILSNEEEESDEPTKKVGPICKRKEVLYKKKSIKRKTSLILNSIILKSDPEIFVCAICEYKTKYKKVLLRHLLKHTINGAATNKLSQDPKLKVKAKKGSRYLLRSLTLEPTIHKCPLCNRHTPDKASMSTHILCDHNQPLHLKAYKCKICGYEALHKSRLVGHINSMHRLPEQFKCDMCPYESTRKVTLDNHKKIHQMASVRTEYKSVMCLF